MVLAKPCNIKNLSDKILKSINFLSTYKIESSAIE